MKTDTYFKIGIVSAIFTALCAGASFVIAIVEVVKHVP